MNKNNPITTNGKWNSGCTTGTGIPSGKCKPGNFRIMVSGPRVFKILTGQLTEIMDKEEFEKESLVRGYTHRYGRNLCHFVQSRAARRRGYRANKDYRYESAQKRHICPKCSGTNYVPGCKPLGIPDKCSVCG